MAGQALFFLNFSSFSVLVQRGQEHRAGTEIEREGSDGTEREQNSGSEIQQCDKGKPVGIFFPDSVLRNLCYFSADSAGIYDLQQLL